MKNLLLFAITTLFCTVAFAQKQNIQLSSAVTQLDMKSVSAESFNAEVNIKELSLENISNENGSFSTLEIEGTVAPSNVGRASLPVISKLIEVPFGAEIQVVINSYDEEVINLSDYGIERITPTQPSYSKSTPIEQQLFVIDNEYYNTDAYETSELISTEVLGVMRGVRMGRIEIRPYRYNPVENTIIVYNNLDFTVNFIGADLATTEEMKARYYAHEFDGSYGALINFQAPQAKDAFSNFNAPIKYIIVANTAFQATLQPFVLWKTKMGYEVIEHYVATGTANTTIKTYIEGLYDAANSSDPAPLYLLIIGDHSGTYSIPAFASKLTSSTYNQHITDVYFTTFDGTTDYLPDMYFGRISAESTTELQNALNKILPYEQYTIPSGTFLNNCQLISGEDDTYAHIYGDSQILYGINNYYYEASDRFTNVWAFFYNNAGHAYNVLASSNSGAEAAILSEISTGVGFSNYTAHCSYDGWADPKIARSDIASFNNQNKYPFMIGNCCQSFMFNQSDSFGEMLLYTANEGAVGYIGASDFSYWSEDAWWGMGLTSLALNTTNWASHTYANTGLGAYDGLWHNHGEAYSDWYYSGRQIVHKGNLAVSASTSSIKQYYWEIYHLVGDPSLMPYNTEPETLTISYGGLSVGSTSLTVTTEPYTYVAISQNGVLWDAEWSGSGTSVTLSFSAIANANPIDIVATKQDRAAHIATITPVSTNPPVADFSGTPTTIMEGQSVAFTDLSQYATGWSWNFGDSQTATTQNPVHTYSTAGTYTVSLTANNNNGFDTETKVNYITVTPFTIVPVAGFTADATSTCTGVVNFTNTSVDASSYLWDFGDGNTSTDENPTHVYTTSGTFTVTLTASNSYSSDTEIKPNYITVALPASPTTTGASNCGPASLTLSAAGTGTLQWYDAPTDGNLITTGTSYTQNFTTTTTYYVQSVIEPESQNGGKPDNSGTGNYFGNPDAIHGLYFNAYTDFLLKSVKVYATGTKNRVINLKNSDNEIIATKTINIANGESRITLDFNVQAGNNYLLEGDGDIDLYRNGGTTAPTLPYPYVITDVLSIHSNTADDNRYYYFFYDWEVVAGEPCISSRAEVTASINTVPTAVTVSGGGTFCGGTATLTATGGTGGTIYWQGTTSSGTSTATASSSQTVSTSGTYYFRARSSAGCWGPEGSATVTINAVPTAVTVSGGGTFCGGTATLTATGGTGGTIYWQGTTSGGTSTATASSSQTVSTSGTYYFRARSSAGCWGPEGSATVAINPVPTAVIVSGGGTQCGGVVDLIASGGSGGTIYWQGTTSGGTSTVTPTTAQSVTESGTYYFRARSSAGCWGPEGSATVTINAVPTAVTVSGGGNYCGTNATLTATGGTGGTIYWQGTTSGGTSTTTASASQTVSGSGTYYFRARSAEGCWGPEGSATVSINPAVTLSLSMTQESTTGASDGTATATVGGGTAPFSYTWSPAGSGASLTGLSAGQYCVTVYDNAGCSTAGCITVTTANQPNPPVAQFTSGTAFGCGTLTIQFTDQSTNNPDEWLWQFGDGATSDLQNPVHTYSNPGQYTVSLTVGNDDGGDEVVMNDYITVWALPTVSLSMTQESSEGAGDGTITAEVSGGTPPYYYEWSGPGSGPMITGLTAGEYCVTVYDYNACSASVCITVTVSSGQNDPVPVFDTDNALGCAPLSVSFTDMSTNTPTSWLWQFGDGSSSDQQNPEHIYAGAGVYSVSLTVTNEYGENTLVMNGLITVYPVPSLSVTVANASGPDVADGSATVSIEGGTAPYTIYWSNSTSGNTMINVLPGNYSVMVVDDNGCVATTPFVIGWNVSVEPVVTAGMKIYPNPTDTYLVVENSGFVADELAISDVLGQVVLHIKPVSGTTRIDVSKLSPGVYFVSTKNNAKKFVQKFVVR